MQTGNGRSVEITLLFTAFIASTYGFGMYLFPAMVEAVRADIPFSYGTMGTISGFVQAGFMICALLAGFLTVRFGAMPMILGSITLCAAGLGGLAIAPNITLMAVCLTLLGGCAAAIWVPMVEVAREHIPKEHQGKALGLMSSGTSYGVFVNSFLLTNLLPGEGWRSLWVATCILVGLLALVGILRLRGTRGDTAKAVAAQKQPILSRVRTIPKGLTAAILFMMFLNGLSCMPYQTYLSAFLQSEAGYSADTAAYMWRIMGVVGMVSGFTIGWLADRITVRLGMIVTYIVLSLSCGLLIDATGGNSPTILYAAAVMFGVSFYAIFGLVPAYISHVFGKGSAALVFAFGNIALGLGGIVGNIFGGMLKVSSGSFEPIYMVMLGAAVCSALLSAVMPSERQVLGTAAHANV
ncbi:MFS transporter [Sinorhizobium meliloti]|uniref:MFS transporter n=1 Tax=Rhizobium meliloti TaxID=382 RepID=UPI000FD75891|nr:MFS transporter [Sinorhizobium meliloti]RVG77998.1 MFS transporter [Sinorhizobium meliloti]RVI32111.1 MFS transporter [Sinorhizobium meliloti]RVI43972.1 MFS transporter [Sinorhizobium meliloti]RVJ18828.1 MFS transporter [Sinorhizobium meliloti]RVJ92640.1 MFS transporter [Sinorhizobium meliloti]